MDILLKSMRNPVEHKHWKNNSVSRGVNERKTYVNNLLEYIFHPLTEKI